MQVDLTKTSDELQNELETVCRFFELLGNPTRLKILNLLSFTPTAVFHTSLIAEWVQVRESVCSHHLSLLSKANLLRTTRNGKFVIHQFLPNEFAKQLNTVSSYINLLPEPNHGTL